MLVDFSGSCSAIGHPAAGLASVNTGVAGSGSSATLVTSGVFAGAQAASFATQTQQSGERQLRTT
ncbi:MAG: hypothetical protein ACR2IK_08955 [Chloroflexota bacterium]